MLDKELAEKCANHKGLVVFVGENKANCDATMQVIKCMLENDTANKGVIVSHDEKVAGFGDIKSTHSIVVSAEHSDAVPHSGKADRSVMRKSPDLVIMGELSDKDRLSACVELGLSEHTVFAKKETAVDLKSAFNDIVALAGRAVDDKQVTEHDLKQVNCLFVSSTTGSAALESCSLA